MEFNSNLEQVHKPYPKVEAKFRGQYRGAKYGKIGRENGTR